MNHSVIFQFVSVAGNSVSRRLCRQYSVATKACCHRSFVIDKRPTRAASTVAVFFVARQPAPASDSSTKGSPLQRLRAPTTGKSKRQSTGGRVDKIMCAPTTLCIAGAVFLPRYEPATHVVNLKLHGPLPATRRATKTRIIISRCCYRQHRPVQLPETCRRGGSCRSAAKRQADTTLARANR